MARNNVIMFPKQSKLNISIIVLLAVFVYVVVAIFSYFSKERIVGYQVRDGVLVDDTRYEAVILRDEEMVLSDGAGYLNYFAAHKERVGVGNLVYALDESGTVMDYASSMNQSENSLDKSVITEFRDELDAFVESFDKQDFGSLYQLDMSLQSQTQKIANNRLLDNIDKMTSLKGLVQYHNAKQAGNVVFWFDGLESLDAQNVTESVFDKTDYVMEQRYNNMIVAPGDFVYKLFNSEKWSIAFLATDEELAQYYLEEEYVNVRFLKNDITIWGEVSLVKNIEGNTVVVLSFQSSSINFAADRFLEIEIQMEQEQGLKIPISSIVQKEFYLVPETHTIYRKAEDTYYVNTEYYTENGERYEKLKAITVYAQEGGMLYVDDTSLEMGNRLLSQEDDVEPYTVSTKAPLTGVYNMNKGYADFKRINVKQQNSAYAIVESGTKYGLSTYDYIVLNASAVNENDFLYE